MYYTKNLTGVLGFMKHLFEYLNNMLFYSINKIIELNLFSNLYFVYKISILYYIILFSGIPSHIDTRGVFDDYILSLSLNSDIIMEFKKENYHKSILLKSKSLLIMSGESRFDWTHGITPRKFDMINSVDGPDIMRRRNRISVTFRKVIQNHENVDVNKV